LNGAPPVNFTLSPSPALASAIVAAHAAAAACLWLLLPGLPGAALAVLVVALGIAAARDRALLAAQASVVGFELTGRDAAVLKLRDGRRVPTAVGQGRFVSRFCVSLPVRAPRRGSLLVTTAMLEPESFRILRLWTLWGRVPGPSRVVSRQLPA
jgi:hypothetical protein